ncbi:flagellar basal body-associated FliL family protein [Erythrobacter sp.]|jgi:flagellar FliL protein|uniref:flagellar basal body-associated FliL family protein n=1 Tax=Erythrobacter sp. TaxID=1042 RepID=UPI002ECBD3A0|nr:flagellar basal body-associated FliL family protein [Erythrobacter sp.]
MIDMSKGKDKSPESSKGSGTLKIVLGAAFLLFLGAGGAYGAVSAGLFGDERASKPDLPKLVLKGDADPYPFANDDKAKKATAVVYGEGGSEYRTAYYSFTESFTSNLSDSPGLIQVELAVSTRRDGRVLQWVQNHELAIRSAILVELAATSEAEAYDVQGKQRLADRLTKAVNEVLEQNEGFGGVDAVHFRGFLVQ